MSNYQLIKNTEWKEVEINGEEKEIPVDWEIKNISQVSFCWDNKRKPLNQTERSNKKGNIPYWGANNIVDYVNDYLVDEEVVLLGEDAAPFYDKTKKVAFVSNEKIWPNNHIHVLKPLINSYFLMTVLNAVQYEKIIGTDSRPKLTQGMMNSIEFSYPSENEQSAIASILSEQESVIENIEQLIQKYESRFQYLSDELLSGRIRVKEVDGEMVLYKNPDDNWKEVEINGEMKEIPSDWEVDTFISYLDFKNGSAFKPSEWKDSGTPIIRIQNLTNNNAPLNFYNGNRKGLVEIDYGDYLFSWSGTLDVFKYVGSHAYLNQHIFKVNSKNNSNIDYFIELLKTQILKMNTNGLTMSHITLGELKSFYLSLTKNIKEQSLIVSIILQQNNLINQQKSLLVKEKQKFDWLLDNLLSGKYLIKEN